MKVGARISIYNFAMRERRAELGWTQLELAQRCGFNVQFINEIESLKMPSSRLSTLIERLNRISQVLEMPFQELFPVDYLDAIQLKKLPKRRTPIIWCREVRLDELPPAADVLQLPDPESILIDSENDRDIPVKTQRLINSLPANERRVIVLRYGLDRDNSNGRTLREIGEMIGVSTDRVRQIEEKAFRLMRHPYRSAGLRELIT